MEQQEPSELVLEGYPLHGDLLRHSAHVEILLGLEKFLVEKKLFLDGTGVFFGTDFAIDFAIELFDDATFVAREVFDPAPDTLVSDVAGCKETEASSSSRGCTPFLEETDFFVGRSKIISSRDMVVKKSIGRVELECLYVFYNTRRKQRWIITVIQ